MRTFILALLLSGCSFISDSEHSERVAQAQVVADEDADGAGPVDDTGSTNADSDQDTDDTGSAPPDTDDTGSAPPDTDDTGSAPPDTDDTGSASTDTDDTGSAPPDTDDTGSASTDLDADEGTPVDIDDTGTPPTDTDGGPPTDIDADGDGFSEIDGDCVDTDPSIFPGAEEVCDGVDNNCDGEVDEGFSPVTYFPDTDGDGHGDSDISVESCTPLDGYSTIGGDCDDTDATVFEGAAERCDTIDNDCDGEVDEDILSTWYHDGDGDRWGSALEVSACDPGPDWVETTGDCDDDDARAHPEGEEVCDYVDNDCDGDTDEGVEPATFFEDSDGDGHGIAEIMMESCELPDGYATVADDCDDGEATTHPGAEEVCDFADNNCDGEIDEGVEPETYYLDADEDEHGNPLVYLESCTPVGGYTTVGDDCDDDAVAIHPEALEVCNGVDDDCDSLIDDDDGSTHVDTMTPFYDDDDGDMYGDPETASIACVAPSGTVADSTDCDDTTSTTNPGALEYCNFVDDDCNDLVDDDALDTTTWYLDDDGDTYGDPAISVDECTPPTDYVADSTDCDDTASTTYPGAPEIGLDGVDNDCNDLLDDMNISDVALWSVTGTHQAPELGSKGVTSAGDVDGDGVDDLLISVPFHDAAGRANCGAIAFFDSPGVGVVSYEDAYLLVEGTLNAKSGRSIVLGNVDDHWAQEIAHAGPGAAGGGTRRGDVWIYDVVGLDDGGSGDGSVHTAQSIYKGRIRGHHTDHENGADLAAGDFSGDGLISLVVGAPGPDDREGDASIYEADDGYMNSSLDPRDATTQIKGEEDGDRFGSVVENVGDVTGDGRDDLVVCAPENFVAAGTPRGRCWLFSNPVSEATDDDPSATDIDWASFSHDVSTDEFGQHPDSIAGGDFMGTSTNEIAFGLPGTNTVLIFDGVAGGGSFEPADAAVVITGSGALGRSISGSTDLDGDGTDDLLVGAPATSTGSLFFLPYDSIISDLVVPGAESASWHSSGTGDGAGFSFSGLGDFDEDGSAEFAIAAPKSDTAASDAGQVWILPAY